MTASERGECARAFAEFARQQFADWRGLPAGCGLAELTAHAPLLNEGVGRDVVGERRRWSEFRLVTFARFSQPVRAWLADQRLWMLDADYPALPESPPRWLSALGEPEARLDCHWDLLRLRGGEWAYPSRGLSVIVNAATGRWLRLSVFAPLTLSSYLQDVRRSTAPIQDEPPPGLM
jgi:hypothetical protein